MSIFGKAGWMQPVVICTRGESEWDRSRSLSCSVMDMALGGREALVQDETDILGIYVLFCGWPREKTASVSLEMLGYCRQGTYRWFYAPGPMRRLRMDIYI